MNSYLALISTPVYFAVKLCFGLAIIKLSAEYLSPVNFATFTQLFFYLAFVNTISGGGVQNGLIRQIAASRTDGDAQKFLTAGQIIWATTATIIGAIALLYRESLSQLLTSDVQHSSIIAMLTLASLASGGIQIYGAVLTGRGRGARSLFAQTVGLLVSGGACCYFLWLGKAEHAVLAFAAGQGAAAVLCWMLVRVEGLVRVVGADGTVAAIAILLRYSGSFLIAASVMPITLLLTRFVYREAFGLTALNDWLAANRISDTSTQFLGIFLIQFVLPALAGAHDTQKKREILRKAFGLCTAGFALALLLFIASSTWVIPLILSDRFLGATWLIALYMAGDILRVSTSLLSNAALARRALGFYIAAEVAQPAIFATGLLLGIAWGYTSAPAYAYVLTHVIGTIVAACAYFRMRETLQTDRPEHVRPTLD